MLEAKFTSIDATLQSELLIKFVTRLGSLQVSNIRSGTFETEYNDLKELDGAEKREGEILMKITTSNLQVLNARGAAFNV